MGRDHRFLDQHYSARSARKDDAIDILSVITAYDLHIAGYSDIVLSDVMEWASGPRFDWSIDSLVVEREGKLVGAAMFMSGVGDQPRYSSVGVTHPEHLDRGIGACLVDFQDHRALEISAAGGGMTLRPWVDLIDSRAMALYSARGFTETRRNFSMLADVSDLDLATETPEGIEIRACTEGDLRVVHELLGETFREHWGHDEQPYEGWHESAYARDDTDLDLWFLAYGEGKPVGVVIGRPNDELGWVNSLGVLKAWRRKGVGGALLRRSFASFRDMGCSRVGLMVDATNETRAVTLYERVGMRTKHVYVALEKTYPGSSLVTTS
jgi:mycothiol synthase